ncbi:MAG TPA: aminoglycoside 3'-phosphotransferase/choline kinase family protein [Longimicrobium sp.]|nr:aminoglycoside 3'-phosphotransferase/choline kinase family protein [Longimicrobium sp.]
MPLLPPVRTREEYLRSPRDEATYRAAIQAICRRHGLRTDRLAKYAGGSTIVFAVGERHVVKLFEPIFAEAAAIERAVLRHVHGKLGIPTPCVVAAGVLEGWSYVVMGQLAGVSLRDAWGELSWADRARVCERLGGAVARLHALPTAPVGLPDLDWPEFLRRQAGSCVERQRAHGLAEHWLGQIPGYLASVELPQGPPVLLHTEVMRDHALVQRNGDGWDLSGLFDFEPAMLGAPEYEFGSVGIFLSGGEPTLFRAFLRAYGYAEAELTPELQRRTLACTLLHRYSNLKWYLETVPPKAATTLEALAAEWFAFGAAAPDPTQHGAAVDREPGIVPPERSGV